MICQYIFDYGMKNMLPNGTMVFPEPPPDYRITIGLGRGSGGILIRLLRVKDFIKNETVRFNLKMTVDYILGRQLDNGHVVDN